MAGFPTQIVLITRLTALEHTVSADRTIFRTVVSGAPVISAAIGASTIVACTIVACTVVDGTVIPGPIVPGATIVVSVVASLIADVMLWLVLGWHRRAIRLSPEREIAFELGALDRP